MGKRKEKNERGKDKKNIMSKKLKIGYISDVHLEFTAKNSHKTYGEITKELIKKIKDNKIDILISCGDISHNLENVIGFYKTLNTLNIPIYAVLGNNDVWNWTTTDTNTYNFTFNQIMKFYKTEFSKLNNCYLLDTGISHFLTDDIEIIGSTGYAQYNSFNANSGMYRGTIDRSKEKKLGKKWEYFFNTNFFFHAKKLLVVTHMSPADWSNEKKLFNDKNVFYFCGHYHYYKNPPTQQDIDNRVFRNAQTGYYNKEIELGVVEI